MNRYFFALKPDNNTRQKIAAARVQIACPGRWVRNNNIHLTVLFLGLLTQKQLSEIISQADKLIIPEFSLNLTTSGSFKKAKVAWLGMDIIPEPLLLLNQQLTSAALKADISIEQKSYKPHVTLARKVVTMEQKEMPAINWKVSAFVLFKSVSSVQGVQYQVVEYFKN